jgi:hypothetical protein
MDDQQQELGERDLHTKSALTDCSLNLQATHLSVRAQVRV